jgi:MYXO-CTERM domain-containing protein
MSCLVAPQSLEQFFGLINSCATAYGGPDWIETAILGLLALALVLLAGIGLLAAGRPR